MCDQLGQGLETITKDKLREVIKDGTKLIEERIAQKKLNVTIINGQRDYTDLLNSLKGFYPIWSFPHLRSNSNYAKRTYFKAKEALEAATNAAVLARSQYQAGLVDFPTLLCRWPL